MNTKIELLRARTLYISSPLWDATTDASQCVDLMNSMSDHLRKVLTDVKFANVLSVAYDFEACEDATAIYRGIYIFVDADLSTEQLETLKFE
jgi:hypothetical protein